MANEEGSTTTSVSGREGGTDDGETTENSTGNNTGTLQREMVTEDTGMKTSADSLEPTTTDAVKKLRPVVEKRELVNYGDLFPSSGSSEEAEPSDSSSSDTEGLLKTVLAPIEKEIKSYDWKSPPENGSQFLLQVMHERKDTAKIVSVKKSVVDKKISQAETDGKEFIQVKMPKLVKMDSAIHEFLPTQSWVSIINHQFSTLFLKVVYWKEILAAENYMVSLPEGIKLPGAFERNEWFIFCFGSKLAKQVKSNPRQRRSVTTAEKAAIDAFFSEDLESNEENADENPNVKILENGMTELCISENKHEECPNEKLPKVEPVEEDASSVSSSVSSSLEDVIREKHPPLLSILLNLSANALEDLLNMHVTWVKHYGWFHEWQGKWIYAILACVEKPLSCDVVADIRDLVRVCSKVRNSVCESKIAASVRAGWRTQSTELERMKAQHEAANDENHFQTAEYVGDEDGETEDSYRFKEFLNTLNLFICLVGNYFQQYDLADTPRP